MCILATSNYFQMQNFKKRVRVSYAMKSKINYNIICVKWLDKNSVQLFSSCEVYQTIGICWRWSPKDNAFIDVERPAIFASYNRGTGGWLRKHANGALHEHSKSDISGHFIDIWEHQFLMHGKHFEKINLNQKHIYLLQFQMEIAHDPLQCTALLSK